MPEIGRKITLATVARMFGFTERQLINYRRITSAGEKLKMES
jgi:hypothetical protein